MTMPPDDWHAWLYVRDGVERLEHYVNAGGSEPCELYTCPAPAYPCACGASHCASHPHIATDADGNF